MLSEFDGATQIIHSERHLDGRQRAKSEIDLGAKLSLFLSGIHFVIFHQTSLQENDTFENDQESSFHSEQESHAPCPIRHMRTV